MTKARGHHSHNRVQVTVEAHLPSDDVCVRPVVAAPKAVADHDRLHESRGGILRRIDAAKFRLRSEQHKVVRTGYEAFGANRSVPTADCRTTRRHRRDTLKHARAIL